MSFAPLGSVPPAELASARLEIHYAAQLVAATAMALGRPAEDDSHTSLVAVEQGALIVGRPTDTPAPVRVGIDVLGLSLRLLDQSLAPIVAYPLAGRSLSEALAWLGGELARCAEVPAPELELPEYDLPSHPLGADGRFACSEPEHFAELARWIGNAAVVLESVRASHKGASDVLLWPHHFDMATLIHVDADRSINVGLSPGDGSYNEPYWYVSPWPYPDDAADVSLASGHWHTSGFVAAILLDGIERETVEAFLASAISASRELLGAGGAP